MKFLGVRAGSIIAAIGACLLLQQVTIGLNNDYVYRLVLLAGLYVTLSVSLNLINGVTGQFSIGHAAFYQVGAYTAGFISLQVFGKGNTGGGLLWVLFMVVVASLAAAVAGFVVGLPSLRLKGDYLAIVTMGFGEIIRIVVQNNEKIGGSYGMNVPKASFPLLALVWLLAIFTIAVCRNLLRTAHGLPFLAVREDEVASAAMGVNVTQVKVTAFVLGSMFAGAAGALLAQFEGFITPATFRMDVSFIILTMVVLGGTGSITGSALAAIFLSYLPEYLRGLKDASGKALAVNGAAVLGGLIAAAFAVAMIKWIIDGGRGTKWTRTGWVGLSLVGAVIIQKILSSQLASIPALAPPSIEANQLRMVIFAVTLIVLMLLRPQGVFAHHEFSWDWLKKIFGGRSRKGSEVTA